MSKLATIKVNAKQLEKEVICCFLAGVVPYVTSPPGLGKSGLAFQIAERNEYLVIDFRLSTAQPEDLSGLPARVGMTNKATMLTYNTFPTEDDVPPTNPKTGRPYRGWLLLMDELSSANKPMQAASYKVVLDRFIGQNKLNSLVHIMCAGNGLMDNSIAIDLSRALTSRMTHFELQNDPPVWIEWAIANSIHPTIITYITSNNKKLHVFDSKSADYAFPCPRTWEMLSKLLYISNEKFGQEVKDVPIQRIASVIGIPGANDFRVFCEYCLELPTFDEILADPMKASKLDDNAKRYAMTDMLASNSKLSLGNAPKIIQYIKRFNREFQTNFVNMVSIYRPEFIATGLEELTPFDKLNVEVIKKTTRV